MNGIKYLLDTNMVIGFLQRSPLVLALFQSKQIKITECAYSSITRMELLSFSSLSLSEQLVIESLSMCSVKPRPLGRGCKRLSSHK